MVFCLSSQIGNAQIIYKVVLLAPNVRIKGAGHKKTRHVGGFVHFFWCLSWLLGCVLHFIQEGQNAP